jgi:hypothetical protein
MLPYLWLLSSLMIDQPDGLTDVGRLDMARRKAGLSGLFPDDEIYIKKHRPKPYTIRVSDSTVM